MKRFYFIFITLVCVCIINSCTTSQEKSFQQLSCQEHYTAIKEIAHLVGKWHNESMYAFINEAFTKGYTPFIQSDFSTQYIDTFMTNFMYQKLTNVVPPLTLQGNVCISSEQLYDLRDRLFHIIEHSDNVTKDIDNLIGNYCVDHCLSTEDMLIVYCIGDIAKATNQLWEEEWDFQYNPLIPKDLRYVKEEKTEEEKREKEKKEQEKKMKELQQADISGAIGGAIDGGAGLAAGGPVGVAWGALLGASAGAAISSVSEWIAQEVVTTANNISPHDINLIDKNSYFYQYLSNMYKTDSILFTIQINNKFDIVLH